MINNEAFVGPANLGPVAVLWDWSSSHTAQIILKGIVFLFFFSPLLLQIRNSSTLLCGKVLCILLNVQGSRKNFLNFCSRILVIKMACNRCLPAGASEDE